MATLKEIVTKAVIGKTKKSIKDTLQISTDTPISNVLGCWIINHTFSGTNENGSVNIKGNYDVNIWYSYDNNTKTNVIVHNYPYEENVNVKLKQDEVLSNNNEIIVRSLTNPQVSDVTVDNNLVKITVDKELGVEIVGDMKVRVNVEDDYDDYEEELEDNNLDIDINENYLDGVNQK